MNILGISGAIGWDSNVSISGSNGLSGDTWVHGAGACLICAGKFIGALEEERLTRIKYDGNYPVNAINALLKKGMITVNDIDIVAYVGSCVTFSTDFRVNGYTEKKLKALFPNATILLIDHHNAHIGAAFFTSPFEEANIFTLDGLGDLHYPDITRKYNNKIYGNNATFSSAVKNKFKLTKFYNSYSSNQTFELGNFFSDFSKLCLIKIAALKNLDDFKETGIIRESGPGKIMGLSAYGNYANVPYPIPFIVKAPTTQDIPIIVTGANLDEWYKNMFYDNSIQAKDIAAWIQYVFQNTVLEFLEKIPAQYKNKNLCFGGGSALNILTNSEIINNGYYDDVHICSAPNDDGLSLGAALLASHAQGINVSLPENIGCIGLDYDDNVILQILHGFNEILYEKWTEENLYVFVASKLKENCIVAWHRGQSEYGPRALGNRSIFANPSFHNKDRLNKVVKFREEWRPYAAIIMEEHLSEWIDIPKKNSRYMLFSGIVKESKRALIPSVTHADNTCRIQTVTPTINEGAYRLLNEFNKLTNIPLLLNTSFNTIPGEPIVETPQDAVKSFLHSQIDYLIINNFVITRK